MFSCNYYSCSHAESKYKIQIQYVSDNIMPMLKPSSSLKPLLYFYALSPVEKSRYFGIAVSMKISINFPCYKIYLESTLNSNFYLK